MHPLTREALRARMLELIAELERQSSGQLARSAAVELDQAKVGRLSRMDALQQQAMQDATQARVVAKLQLFRRTLARVNDEDFGLCAECGEAIAIGRLEIDPIAIYCIGCATQLQAPS